MKTFEINKQELNKYLLLFNKNLSDLQKQAKEITKAFFGNKIEFCSIISAKTGKCSEDCKYCAQSIYYETNCQTHEMLDIEEILKAAYNAKENGAKRFGIVTSGRYLSDKDLDEIVYIIKEINKLEGMICCLSSGITSFEQALKLKEAGLSRFNHNINTSRSYYKKICTTHDFQERINTVLNLTNAGIEVCCGVILGMGETRQDIIEMALEIKALNPAGVPINILHPIPGTPFENSDKLISSEDILKSIAIFRIILPDKYIRLCGGRAHNLSIDQQIEAIHCGINSIMVGNLLTTTGLTPEDDRSIICQSGSVIEEV